MRKIVLKLAGSNDFFTQEAYKTLRTNLQFCGQKIRVIAITSCHENEGKTTTSLNIGKSLAELGKKVLVIDADMRKSVMAGRHTNVKRPEGLSEILTGMASLDDCVHVTQNELFHVIFAGKYPPNPVELLSSSDFSDLIMQLRENYDYIIVDTPPLGRVIDTAVVVPNCDGTILVIADNAIGYREAQEVVGQLKKSGSKILGVVRNNIRHKKSGYYYSRGYYSAYGRR